MDWDRQMAEQVYNETKVNLDNMYKEIGMREEVRAE
jgi:hypothetical protein